MTNHSSEEQRPALVDVTTGAELMRWYWLKEELVAGARHHGVSSSGSKAELTERLARFLDTGEMQKPTQRRVSSSFDWAKADLSPETVITDSYRNGPNVRAFFKEHYGPSFTFNIAFMQWMRDNVGKTLADAVEARRQIAARERVTKPAIPKGNQYNAYTRAFFKANPDKTASDARACWAWKRSQPGSNAYDPADLVALKERDKSA
ncbi:MAG: DUF6434 domain-containing protein [Pseudomonadota bacterium]